MSERKKLKESVKKNLIRKSGCRCTICNKDLSQSKIIYSKKCGHGNFAHINAYSKNGPRYDPELEDVNDEDNLMFVCMDCHKDIDSSPDLYTEDILRSIKMKKESLVKDALDRLTQPQYTAVVCSAPVGTYNCPINNSDLNACMLEKGILIRPEVMCLVKNVDSYESSRLLDILDDNFKKRIGSSWDSSESNPICIFGFGPMYLLMSLGKHFASIPTATFVPICTREWGWIVGDDDCDLKFSIKEPKNVDVNDTVVLELNCTAESDKDQVIRKFGEDTDIWSIDLEGAGIDKVTTQGELHEFGKLVVNVLDSISRHYGSGKKIYVVPRVCNALAITFGMSVLPKTHPDIIMCDVQNNDGTREIAEIGKL